jgi:hypothetical protein
MDTWLRVIGKALQDLPAAERHWADPRESEDERVRDRLAFHAEWDEQVTRFEELAAAHEAGQLSPEQDTRFRALVMLLTQTVPELQRLKLRVPSPTWCSES